MGLGGGDSFERDDNACCLTKGCKLRILVSLGVFRVQLVSSFQSFIK